MRRSEAMLDNYRWRDYVALPEDDRRELIDGQLLEIDMPKRWHERMVMDLGSMLRAWCKKRGLHVLGSNYRVRISDKRGVQPDIQVLSDATYRSGQDDGLEKGHPELVVEIVSPTSKSHDRVRKLDWYAQIGVPEYWIVDADARTLERLVLADGKYTIAQHGSGDEIFRPKSMRGLQIDLADLWAAL
jgi:Uma2 family endonuclease